MAGARPTGGARPRARSGTAPPPFGAMSAANWIAMNANQYLHRYGAPGVMLGLIALNVRPPQRRAEPERDLPGPDDHGRLPPGSSDHLPVRALRLRHTVRLIDRGDRLGGPP